jgi:hypothetical protein
MSDKTHWLTRLTGGAIEITSDTEEPSVPAAPQHTAAKSTRLPLPQAFPAPVPNLPAIGEVDADKVEGQYQKDLTMVVDAAPKRFHDFMDHRADLADALKESLSGEALEKAAIAGAVRVSDLTSADVSEAVLAMKTKASGIAADFGSWLEGQKEEMVQKPTQKISQVQAEIGQKRTQIQKLQAEIEAAERSIQPAQADIAANEEKLAASQRIFQAANARVLSYVEKLGQTLQARLGSKS